MLDSVSSAANYRTDAVSPRLKIVGPLRQNMGPRKTSTAQVSNGACHDSPAGTHVLFDCVAALCSNTSTAGERDRAICIAVRAKPLCR